MCHCFSSYELFSSTTPSLELREKTIQLYLPSAISLYKTMISSLWHIIMSCHSLSMTFFDSLYTRCSILLIKSWNHNIKLQIRLTEHTHRQLHGEQMMQCTAHHGLQGLLVQSHILSNSQTGSNAIGHLAEFGRAKRRAGRGWTGLAVLQGNWRWETDIAAFGTMKMNLEKGNKSSYDVKWGDTDTEVFIWKAFSVYNQFVASISFLRWCYLTADGVDTKTLSNKHLYSHKLRHKKVCS